MRKNKNSNSTIGAEAVREEDKERFGDPIQSLIFTEQENPEVTYRQDVTEPPNKGIYATKHLSVAPAFHPLL